MTVVLSHEQLDYLKISRVARLATSDRKGSVSIVPIVFANIGSRIYSVLDNKTKNGKRELKRLRNIRETRSATLLFDNYSENWDQLSYLILFCAAKVIESGKSLGEKKFAEQALKEKYPQYLSGGYFPEKLEEAVFVRLEPKRAVSWQNSH